jgi:hypothetical protein
MPWVTDDGLLTIKTGRLTGAGRVSVNQGSRLPYAGGRLRVRGRFNDSDQEIRAAFDAAADGTDGLGVVVSSAGSLAIIQDGVTLAETEIAPLENDVDWFVEAIVGDDAVAATLARTNYGSEKMADVRSSLLSEPVQGIEGGSRAALELRAPGGLAPSVDEISVARCGEVPPVYARLFEDTFERADSTNLGKADFPTAAQWIASSTDARIVGGALQVASLANARVLLEGLPVHGLRLRTTISTPDAALWANVEYNQQANGDLLAAPGFWIWGPQDNAIYSDIFGATGERKQTGRLLTPGVKYYVQLDRDGDAGSLVIRTGSYTGAIVLAHAEAGVTVPSSGDYLRLGTSSSSETRFEEIRLDEYVPE